MAAKKMTSAPMTRLSAGVYRDASGKTVKSTTGKATAATSSKKSMTTKPVKSAPIADPNLNANQQQIQGNLEQGDVGLTDTRNQWTDKVGQMGDFNYTGPAAPQYNADEQARFEQQYLDKFNRYDAPQRQQENDDLARWSQSTGNSVDSPAYAAKAKQLSDSQNARTEDARNSAMQQGLAQATGQFDLGQQAHQTAYGEQTDQYNRPIVNAGAIQGLISPSWANAQQNSQQLGVVAAQGAQQRKTQLAPQWMPPRSGGGGGSGGGGKNGGGMTSAPQGYVPQYMGGQQANGQPSAPGYGNQLANSLLPKIIGPMAEYGGNQAVKYISSLLG